MKNYKRLFALALAGVMAAGVMGGCSKTNATGSGTEEKAKEIYFLNFKPEIADKYKAIADEYKQKTGVTVKVVTAASGTYAETFKAEAAKSDAPTIFQCNGPVGYQSTKDNCADLTGWDLLDKVSDKNLLIKDGKGIYGIPYAIEGYGIIYNDAVMKKYFALAGKKSTLTKAEDIKSFADLKTVVEDMTAHKKDLGIEGVFASTSLKSGEQWRWQTHLADIPFYYEFKENTKYSDTVTAGLNTDKATFKYGDNFKNIFDLYIKNSCTDAKLLGSKSVDDSMAEFALGKAAMVQNGNWAWAQIAKVSGNTVKEDDIKFLPIYTGISGEDKQGICIGTENYFSINKNVSKAKQKASEDFISWLYTSAEGKKHVTNDLGFIAPFTSFADNEKPTDPLAKQVATWSANKNVTNVAWTFQCFPSEQFKNDFGAALLEYAQGKSDFNKVKDTVVKSWATEKAATK